MRPAEVTIVLAGAWNRAIFTPDWVQRKLFAGEGEVVVEVLFGEVSGLRYVSPGVSLTVLAGRLQITPARVERALIDRAERVAVDLLGALPETPTQARGINLVVREPEVGPYAPLFLDPPSITAEGVAAIEGRRVGWRFAFGEEQVNVQAELSRAGVSVEFNFHRAGSPALSLQPTIEGHIGPCIERAREIAGWMGATIEEVTL
jgi:hypothetical protein